ncbi:hypothetical protein ACFQJ8_24435 [Halocatena marina]|uniref:hypothetical protein n=1 Tax=Halocatena marina TaxID=2934937 RepID=UPI003607689A
MTQQQGLPRDATLLAGLALSIFGLTNVFSIAGTLLERWTILSTVQLGVGVGFLSMVVGYGFAAGSVRRRSLVGLALTLSWMAFFYGGALRLLGWGGLLVCIGLLVFDGVREDRLGIGVHFLQSGGDVADCGRNHRIRNVPGANPDNRYLEFLGVERHRAVCRWVRTVDSWAHVQQFPLRNELRNSLRECLL